MNSDTFLIWLQGFLDAAGATLNAEQMTDLKSNVDSIELRGPFRRMQQDMKAQRSARKAAKQAAKPA